MKNVLEKVLKKIVPSKNEIEEFSRILKDVLHAADMVLKPLKLEKTIAGSFIRDTWLADKRELDLFIMFPVSYSRERLEKVGIKIGKKIMKKLNGRYEIAYAEHPYVKGWFRGFMLDIVPCYKVESASKIKSAVDRTPFHNKYIIENLKPKMANEVRLLKQFCKAMGVYGSDVRTQGFSGYLCELLIIKYKTFKNLLIEAKKWEFGIFIDLENHCKFDYPTEQFKGQPLIVIDPTDPKRNVAAALSDDNFMKFIETSGEFIKNPSTKFFEIDKTALKGILLKKYLKKRGTEFFVIEFKRPEIVDDILWSQMRKTSVRMANLLGENEFEIFKKEVWSDEKRSYLLFEMKVWKLPEIRKVMGPPVGSQKHADEFKKKYASSAYIEGDRWAAEVKRKNRDCALLFKKFLKKPSKKLQNEGVRSYIAKSISNGFKILGNKKIEELIAKNKDFAVFLKKYFERKL